MSTQANAGIVGASGYSGELLVKLLSRHPAVNLAAVTSRQLAGTPVDEAIPALRGELPGLAFIPSDPGGLTAMAEIDIWFLALPHGVAAQYALALVGAGKKVLDLSADFRLGSADTYEEFYGAAHPAPDLLRRAAYVIPELMPDDSWTGAPLIACPGCYPTSIITPLTPLLRDGVIAADGIVIASFSGVSGAGKKATEAFSYCERDESAVAYGLPKHRHLSEIEEQLSLAAGARTVVQFCPHLAPMRRGIISTISAPAGPAARGGPPQDALYESWGQAFGGRPFTAVLPSGTFPDSAHVVGGNRVDISAVFDPRTDRFAITSALDNLMKGASGQAVQIMNLWCGFPETSGLA